LTGRGQYYIYQSQQIRCRQQLTENRKGGEKPPQPRYCNGYFRDTKPLAPTGWEGIPGGSTPKPGGLPYRESEFCCRQRGLTVSGATGARFETGHHRKTPNYTFILFLMLLFVLCGQLSAQSVTSLRGIIFDGDDGAPLAGAAVEIAGTGYTAAADEYGHYSFKNLPGGDYMLKISAPGYESYYQKSVRINDGIVRQINVRLYRKIYYLGKITVQGVRKRLSSDRVEILQKEEIIQSRARDIPELLETVPGVYIQKTNAGSGPSQIKIRGSAPEHVLVLVDGQRINPASNGVADLRSIPIEMVERLEIHKGGASAEFGPDALGGVLNIITRKARLGERLSVDGERGWGSWKNELYHLNLSNLMVSEKFSSNFAYSLKQSIGDFQFTDYQVEPNPVAHSGTRINNQNETRNYFSSGIYEFHPKLKLTYSGQYYQSQSGLPGGAVTPNEWAVAEDDRQMLNTSLFYELSPDRNMKFDLGLSRYEQRFTDTVSTIKYDSKFINSIFTVRHNQHFAVWASNLVKAGIEYRKDILKNDDLFRPAQSMGRTSRDNYALYLNDEQHVDLSGAAVVDEAVIDLSVRFDHVRTSKDSLSWQDTAFDDQLSHWSPKVGVALSKGTQFSYMLRGSYGKSLRLPSINALFWKGDARSRGNPELRPEKSEHSEAGFELAGEFGPIQLSGGMTYFHSHMIDLVVWMPNSGVWQPVNNERALITGHEEFIELKFFDRIFSLMYQNTITTAINKSSGHNTYNKRLVFYPHYITSMTARLNYKLLLLSYSVRSVDRAYTNSANTRYYEAYRVDDLTAGVQLGLNDSWKAGVDLKLNNVWDESYVLMTHYPMPGREWYLGVKLTYGAGNVK